jgi:hypothetical protein
VRRPNQKKRLFFGRSKAIPIIALLPRPKIEEQRNTRFVVLIFLEYQKQFLLLSKAIPIICQWPPDKKGCFGQSVQNAFFSINAPSGGRDFLLLADSNNLEYHWSLRTLINIKPSFTMTAF